MERDIVLLSTADWDNPFWTNKQHVAVELAKQGHRVLYIDSLGLRRPSVSKQDIHRVIKRINKALRPPFQARDRLYVWSPVMIPLQKYRLVRKLNRLLFSLGLKWILKRLRMSKDLLWTYNPLTTRIIDLKLFKQVVYHCVDEIKAQPGMPVTIIEEAEKELCEGADLVFTTSPHLTETRKKWNKNTYYFSNVADFRHFNKALDQATLIPNDLLSIPAPRIGFIGAISGYKVDFDLIRRLALSRPGWSIVLIGKVGEGDPWTDPSILQEIPNIYLLGPRRYDVLPNYLKGIDVAILPNKLNDYTRSMFPMKFFEYLAAGRPVVSVDLDSLKEFRDVVYIAKTPESFIIGIEKALNGDVAPLETRLNIAKKYTYEHRNLEMMKLVEKMYNNNVCIKKEG